MKIPILLTSACLLVSYGKHPDAQSPNIQGSVRGQVANTLRVTPTQNYFFALLKRFSEEYKIGITIKLSPADIQTIDLSNIPIPDGVKRFTGISSAQIIFEQGASGKDVKISFRIELGLISEAGNKGNAVYNDSFGAGVLDGGVSSISLPGENISMTWGDPHGHGFVPSSDRDKQKIQLLQLDFIRFLEQSIQR